MNGLRQDFEPRSASHRKINIPRPLPFPRRKRVEEVPGEIVDLWAVRRSLRLVILKALCAPVACAGPQWSTGAAG
jgi:hypothetical protein